jgi:dTDP-4-dehydrorhamnose reductase
MQTKKVLILGGSGYLGANLVSLFRRDENFTILASYNKHRPKIECNWFQFEIAEIDKLKNTIDVFKPDVIVNCIALANVESCEKSLLKAIILNSEFPKALAALSNQTGTKLIQISTDHFSSNLNVPRSESSVVWGVNNYGKSKLLGETHVLRYSENLVIRVNFFGKGDATHKSSLDRLIRSIERNDDLNGFSDIFFTPVSIGKFYEYLSGLITHDVRGLINVASSNETTKYSFMKSVSEFFPTYSGVISPVKFEPIDYGLVQRPKYMSLDSKCADELLKIQQLSVQEMIHQVLFNSAIH